MEQYLTTVEEDIVPKSRLCSQSLIPHRSLPLPDPHFAYQVPLHEHTHRLLAVPSIGAIATIRDLAAAVLVEAGRGLAPRHHRMGTDVLKFVPENSGLAVVTLD